MLTNKIQIEFLKKANEWLSDFKNQKKFAISDDDTNPHESRLCLYVLGGWAINRYSFYRETNDIDLIADKKQIFEILTSFNYKNEFKPISSPDSNESFTQKHTLRDNSGQKFSLEARFFDSANQIDLGNLKLDRNWLYQDSRLFIERTIGSLPFIKVPSPEKLIVLKLFSIVGRNDKDKDKIIKDFIDVHLLQISDEYNKSDINKLVEILKNFRFINYLNSYKERLDRLISEIQAEAEHSIQNNSILFIISDKLSELSTIKSTSKKSVFKSTNDDSFQIAEGILNRYDDWLVGALNFDEDLHFSSFYLDQSWRHRLPDEFKEFGYDSMVASYQDFKETYFIPETECKRAAENLINKINDSPEWFNGILDKIIENADKLLKVFPFDPGSTPFSSMKDAQLLEYYRKHREVHTDLYVVSRIPEALDRGKNYFTDSLKSYIKSLHPDLADAKKLNEIFEIFTFPEDISIAGKEFIEFMSILERIKNDKDSKELFSGTGSSTRKILLKTKPEFLKEIEKHREKWMYWNYHGYGNRVLRDISFFLEKFRSGMNDSLALEKALSYQRVFKDSELKKQQYYNLYSVDPLHKKMFSLYSKIGAVKLYRRYIQLQNFYFLDQLISRISYSLNIEEEIIRNLIPEEIEQLLSGNLTIETKHRERVKYSTVVYSDQNKLILSGEEAKAIAHMIKELSRDAVFRSDVLEGEPCVTHSNLIKGHCKVVKHKDDLIGLVFNFGDILVCEAADPDLYDLMRNAGVVITEQGGVTSHSATYCRENNIKSITGVKGLLDNLFHNDLVEVDTMLGKIFKIASGVSESIITPDDYTPSQTDIGMKAFNLIRLKKAGFKVPDFFCIPLDSLRKVLQKGTQDSIGAVSQALWDEVNKKMDGLKGDLFAIRSSFSNEDGDHFSGAGLNRSELLLSKEDITKTIISISSEVLFSANNKISGSLIIQDMILGDISGVVFSSNPVNKNLNEIVLEAVPGGNELLTDGSVRPMKFILDKQTLKIKDHPEESIWKDLISDKTVLEIGKACIEIEQSHNKSQDIEWTVENGILYILQSRPLTSFNPDLAPPYYRRHPSRNLNNIINIYRSYRVPLNLQRHMIQVAAVAKCILVNRKDRDKYNERNVLTTLLLHDIGNIVKGLDESFAGLFPEGYKYMPYWKAVQRWIAERYGDIDTVATMNMVKEIGVSDRVLYLLENKQFLNNQFIHDSNDMELKICAYSDQRVSPYGVLSIRDRLNEAVNRYRGIKKISVNDPNRDTLIELAVKIEGQIFKGMKKHPKDVVNNIELYQNELRDFNLS